jgi:flagellar protein FlgJ
MQQPTMGLTSSISTRDMEAKVSGAGKNGEDTKLKKACSEMEGIFFNMMLKEMRKTVDKSKLIGDSQHEQEIFQGMMDEHVANQIATDDRSANGLANVLYRQLSGRKAYAGAMKMGTSTVSSEQAAQAADNQKGAITQ